MVCITWPPVATAQTPTESENRPTMNRSEAP